MQSSENTMGITILIMLHQISSPSLEVVTCWKCKFQILADLVLERFPANRMTCSDIRCQLVATNRYSETQFHHHANAPFNQVWFLRNVSSSLPCPSITWIPRFIAIRLQSLKPNRRNRFLSRTSVAQFAIEDKKVIELPKQHSFQRWKWKRWEVRTELERKVKIYFYSSRILRNELHVPSQQFRHYRQPLFWVPHNTQNGTEIQATKPSASRGNFKPLGKLGNRIHWGWYK